MTHPSTEQLRRLIDERLVPQERDSVETHVNGCDACLEKLDAWQRLQPANRALLADLLLHPPCAEAPLGAGVEPCSNDTPPPSSNWPKFPGYEILAHVGGGMSHVYKA